MTDPNTAGRTQAATPTGPLVGVKVVELAGIGPGPFCAMVLSDMGADVIRVDRTSAVHGTPDVPPADTLNRGRRSVALDLKSPEGIEVLLDLVGEADALLEGYRPGVCERLGIGPDVCLERNPRLVFARMTGWGQDGPYADRAGHDINYIALAGALDAIGRAGDKPLPPLNLVGDFGGGGLLAAFGIVCGVLEARTSGRGQVVDVAMVDGAALLMSMMHAFRAMGIWRDERGTNLLDTGAYYYETYETKDGKYISVGALEPKFFAELIDGMGLSADEVPGQQNRAVWPEGKEQFEAIFKTKTRDEWCELLEGRDACFAPVLTMAEAPFHPHMAQRGTFVERDGVVQASPAPRFSRTPGSIHRSPSAPGQDTDEVLADWGIDADRVAALRSSGAIA